MVFVWGMLGHVQTGKYVQPSSESTATTGTWDALQAFLPGPEGGVIGAESLKVATRLQRVPSLCCRLQ